jgi:hypothetical protein
MGGRREAEELAPKLTVRQQQRDGLSTRPKWETSCHRIEEPFGGVPRTGRGVIGLAGCMFSGSPSPPVTARFVSNVGDLRVTGDPSPPVIERHRARLAYQARAAPMRPYAKTAHRRGGSALTTSPSSLTKRPMSRFRRMSSTVSEGRQSLTPCGVTTIGRLIRIGFASMKSSN